MSTSEQLKSPRTWESKQKKKKLTWSELYSKAKVKVTSLLTWCLHFTISNLAITVEVVHTLWIIVTCTWPIFLCCVRWSVRCESFCFSDWAESDSARICLPPLTAGAMGVASRDPDTSSVDAEKNDTLHSDTQREQAKGITKFFQSSTINLNLNLIFLKMY